VTDSASASPSDFVRFTVDGAAGRLETAITTYRKGPVEVVLYGAVHIADEEHYQILQDRFATRDALLFEMIAPEDHRPSRDEEKSGLVSMLQAGLKNALELEFQLDAVDYSPANFVHADMTPREFRESMEERGESLLSIMFAMMQNGPAMQAAMQDLQLPDDLETDLVQAFRTGQGRHTMRILFASQLEQMELLAAGGKESTLLEGRNEKCLTVLQREIANGKRRIGIYYGAAHLPHMERRLVDDLGFRKTGHEWIPGWDCAPRADPKFDRALYIQRRDTKRTLVAIAAATREWRTNRSDRKTPSMAELLAAGPSGSPWFEGSAEDAWGNPYLITDDWRIVSAGQDGEVGTEDDLEERVKR